MVPAGRMQASDLLQDWVDDEKMLRHALAVEGVMRYFAQQEGQDPITVRKWGLAGLLHDFDYQECPDEHCHKSEEIMRQAGYDEDFIRAIVSHGYMVYTDVKPETSLEKSLFAAEGMTELITAVVLAQPGKNIADTQLSDIMEKFDDSSFAETVNRSVIKKAAELLDWSVERVAEMTLAGLRTVSYEAGLAGEEEDEE